MPLLINERKINILFDLSTAYKILYSLLREPNYKDIFIQINTYKKYLFLKICNATVGF